MIATGLGRGVLMRFRPIIITIACGGVLAAAVPFVADATASPAHPATGTRSAHNKPIVGDLRVRGEVNANSFEIKGNDLATGIVSLTVLAIALSDMNYAGGLGSVNVGAAKVPAYDVNPSGGPVSFTVPVVSSSAEKLILQSLVPAAAPGSTCHLAYDGVDRVLAREGVPGVAKTLSTPTRSITESPTDATYESETVTLPRAPAGSEFIVSLVAGSASTCQQDLTGVTVEGYTHNRWGL
jgi:hypothetical protein